MVVEMLKFKMCDGLEIQLKVYISIATTSIKASQ
jgi:hypothetical protein